jgi:hypothetical protein
MGPAAAHWAEDVLKVEAATSIPRWELRPDLYPRNEIPSNVAPASSVAEHPSDVACDRSDNLQADNDK